MGIVVDLWVFMSTRTSPFTPHAAHRMPSGVADTSARRMVHREIGYDESGRELWLLGVELDDADVVGGEPKDSVLILAQVVDARLTVEELVAIGNAAGNSSRDSI